MQDYHPLLMSAQEASIIRQHINDPKNQSDLISITLKNQIDLLEDYMSRKIEIPMPGEAGGAEHNQHKQNYIHLNLAAKLWLVTENKRYKQYAYKLLVGYAQIYPDLPFHVSHDSNPPGRLFHQTLNESMWLLYAADAYSCIYETLSHQEKDNIETHLFRPMLDLLLEINQDDFDIIHNHGLWSVAAVGICGYAINDQSIVDKAIYGLKQDGESGGFLAQLTQLFSIDGYYMEGPYYQRFAIRPLCLFAEAIERRQPGLGIFEYHNQVIKKTCYALISTLFPDGTFPALNDSSKTMGVTDEGVLIATNLCFQRYGQNSILREIAEKQNTVWLSLAGLMVSRCVKSHSVDTSKHISSTQKIKNQDVILSNTSILLRDGKNGEKGGLGILRQQHNNGMHMALLWFGQHGSDHTLHSALDHGHFDGLHFGLFNRGQEVLRDYGFGRWVNIEPKFGGRYIEENKSYCKQTIAHNTVVVDQQSQHLGNPITAEKHTGALHFFVDDHKSSQGISATTKNYYPGVDMQRTLLMINVDSLEEPILLDLFRLTSDTVRQYDYPLHYSGQIVRTDFNVETFTQLSPLGDSNGYQHLWQLAKGSISDQKPSAIVSWLMGSSYHSMITTLPCGGDIIFCTTGANDPNFNLRNEPAILVRTQAKDQLFATVFETHGLFDEALELSENARGKLERVEIIGHNTLATIVRLYIKESQTLTIMVSNSSNPYGSKNKVIFQGQEFEWDGAYEIQ